MAALLTKVEAFCKQNKLFAAGDTILAACSGGPDSLALVQLLLALREKYQLQLAVGHFEHGIRGAASQADAAFVREFCAAAGVPFYGGQGDTPGYAAEQHISLELAARTLRYQFLRETAAHLCQGTLIATAHQADDQAETVLMRILRGTGVDGLAGMQPRAAGIIRPLLTATRVEIEAYCREQQLQPRHDATNDVPDCLRNRLRLELLPYLRKQYNPDIAAALCRLSAVASEESDFLSAAADGVWDEVQVSGTKSIKFRLDAFCPLHPALQLALLRRAAASGGDAHGVGYVHYLALRQLLQTGRTGSQLRLPNGVRVVVAYGTAEFSWQSAAMAAATHFSVPLAVPGLTDITGTGQQVRAELLPAPVPVDGVRCILCDADQLVQPLRVRSRRPGDRLTVEQGTARLKKLLIDRKVPQADRDRIPVFTAGDAVFWVGGVRQAAIARVTAVTRRFLRLTLIPDAGTASSRD